ncbi:hypothetical protein [Microlunatus speluncae]|uniref:hypothetical protein n=1 Tax=Microlunatus speluncae TaxID=2594267 RepID=UPI00126652F1|nr:hypothetical protein [Microlunatus speluncae]
MDAPIFPTEKRGDEWVATDLIVRAMNVPNAGTRQPEAEPATLEAGYEYRIAQLDHIHYEWLRRPEGGDAASWAIQGAVRDLPAYVPSDQLPQRIVKNKVAWHMVDESYQDTPSGVCEP